MNHAKALHRGGSAVGVAFSDFKKIRLSSEPAFAGDHRIVIKSLRL